MIISLHILSVLPFMKFSLCSLCMLAVIENQGKVESTAVEYCPSSRIFCDISKFLFPEKKIPC